MHLTYLLSLFVFCGLSAPIVDYYGGQEVIADLPFLYYTPTLWTKSSSGTVANATLNGNKYLLVQGKNTFASRIQSFSTLGYSNVMIQVVVLGKTLAASGICRVEYSLDQTTWYQTTVLNTPLVTNGDAAQAVYTASLANNQNALYIKFSSSSTSTGCKCYFGSLTLLGTPSGSPSSSCLNCPPVGTGPSTRTLLTFSQLTSGSTPTSPVDNSAFQIPSNAQNPTNTFSGFFRLPSTAGSSYVYVDTFSYKTGFKEYNQFPGDLILSFQQIGTHLFPCVSHGMRSSNSLHEVVLSGGRVWNEASDNGWTRATMAFSFTQRNANCVWNGMMMFLFKSTGISGSPLQISKVYYQVTQETCLYFQFDLWNLVQPILNGTTTNACSASRMSNFTNWRASLASAPPLNNLANVLSGVDFSQIPASQVSASAISIKGVYYKGVFYNDLGPGRVGTKTNQAGTATGSPFPYPEYLLLPSYSTAKTSVTYLMYLRLAQKYPGLNILSQPLKNYLPTGTISQCANFGSQSISTVISMVDQRYSNSGYMTDEDSLATSNNFFLVLDEKAKTTYACSWQAKTPTNPPTWVYHTGDSYLATVGLSKIVQTQEGIDLRKFWVNDIIRPLGLSPMFADLRTTYETWYSPQVWGGWGAFYYRDDITKIAKILNDNSGFLAPSVPWLHNGHLLTSFQRDGTTSGNGYNIQSLVNNPTNNPAGWTYKYHNSLWAINLYQGTSYQTQCSLNYQPFSMGYGGIEMIFLHNKIMYTYFSDNAQFYWSGAAMTLSGATDIATGVSVNPCNFVSSYGAYESSGGGWF